MPIWADLCYVQHAEAGIQQYQRVRITLWTDWES